MPPSFAVTELLIVLTAYFCSLKLRKYYPFAVIGISLFGLAALIGVYRFSSGQVDQLASIHKYISQAGALLGIILITKEIILAQALLAAKASHQKMGLCNNNNLPIFCKYFSKLYSACLYYMLLSKYYFGLQVGGIEQE